MLESAFMKKCKISEKPFVLFIINILVSITAISFSYLYGYSNKSTGVYAALMSLDSKVKQQSYSNFLHGYIELNEKETNSSSTYDKFLNLQRKTKTNYEYYNSFLVLSKNNQFVEFDVDYGLEYGSLHKSKLLEVCTYHDYNFMESLGLPLYKATDDPSNINSKNNASLGAYISATHAESIVSNNGMLESSNNDLKEAFNKLLTSNEYVFSISSNDYNDGEQISMSINAIYIDYNHSYLFNDFQKQVQTSRYGDYSKTFDYWFEGSIITFSYQMFSKECSYVFDIRRNYGNLDRFFNRVTGYDYAKNDLSVSFVDGKNVVYEESHLLNEVSTNYNSKPNYIYLILSILLFASLCVFFDFFSQSLSKKRKILFIGVPFFAFASLQINFHLLIDFGLKKYFLYQMINPVGNVIFLIAIAIILINSIIWSLYVNKNKK